mgnify:CR=1 FL=1
MPAVVTTIAIAAALTQSVAASIFAITTRTDSLLTFEQLHHMGMTV